MKKITVYIALVFALLTVNTAFADFKVYSYDNQYLGYVLDIIPNHMIYNDQIQAYYLLEAKNNGWYDLSFELVYFESDNCTGTPYIRGELVKPNVVMNDKIYKIKNEIKEISVSSFRSCHNVTYVCGCVFSSPVVYRVMEVIEISLPFSQPIQGPLRIEHEASGQTKAVVIPLMN